MTRCRERHCHHCMGDTSSLASIPRQAQMSMHMLLGLRPCTPAQPASKSGGHHLRHDAMPCCLFATRGLVPWPKSVSCHIVHVPLWPACCSQTTSDMLSDLPLYCKLMWRPRQYKQDCLQTSVCRQLLTCSNRQRRTVVSIGMAWHRHDWIDHRIYERGDLQCKAQPWR